MAVPAAAAAYTALADPPGSGQQRAAFSNPPADRRSSHGCNLPLCAHRCDSEPWQGDDTLHWTFEMTQRFRWKPLLNIYQFSVRGLFSPSSTLLSAAAAACSLLQIKAPLMKHSTGYFGCVTDAKRKERQSSHVRLLPSGSKAAQTCPTFHRSFTLPLQKELTVMSSRAIFC